MADVKKTHTLALGKHSEEVTEAELNDIKKSIGARRFSEYTVSEIQPTKPADIPNTPAKAPKASSTAE